MRWEGRRQSDNIEDRRGMRPVTIAGGGLGTLILILVVMFLGGDPRALLQQLPQQQGGAVQQGPVDPAQEPLKQFVATVLADTEDVWNKLLPEQARVPYREPTLVLFTDRVQSACGMAGAQVGPFYCPADEKLYIDLDFYQELERMGGPGDFAQAYVIAHEVGHHVQNLLGTAQKVDAARRRLPEAEANDLSVRMELQADFYAGVWAHHAQRMKQILDSGDIEEGLRAAAAIGDDRLQMEAQGYVRPDAFTHGSSEQRVRWFKKGLETGDLRQGDTFNTERL
jgi:hypothetical protein